MGVCGCIVCEHTGICNCFMKILRRSQGVILEATLTLSSAITLDLFFALHLGEIRVYALE